jgi:hypothetical protein
MWNRPNRFNSLPRDASDEQIYAHAGEMYDRAVGQHPAKYFSEEEYNREVFYLACEAKRRRFAVLTYMTKPQVAERIRESIDGYIEGQRRYREWEDRQPRDRGYGGYG